LQHKIINNFLNMFQKALGHSSLGIITYLCGLEVSELEESDIPTV